MSDYVIEAEVRTIRKKKVNLLRAKGLVPCTIYGPNTEPASIQVPYRHLELILRGAGGTNLIDIKAGGETYVVLAREVQRDVLKGTILHADFFAVDETSKLRITVPINLVGESPALEARLGILMTGTNSIVIETLPSKMIDRIEVDISILEEIGDAINVSDLKLDEEITIINDPSEMLARIAQTSADRAEEDLEEGEEGEEGEEESGSAEPEVISRGRDEEED